ncbi:hypothetical protein CEE44_02555 [Candidatus Woesearchaeota archaeon B3_Woes]|nr:MAG: hypothetical protein CEE44_02555 [Candidatus Woesearchaeota archaeon B3_Woes]
MIDFVFPDGNEKEFIEMAGKLGYNSLCFVYSLKDFNSKKKKYSGFDIKYGVLVDEKKVPKNKLSDFVLVKCRENTRNVIEKNKDLIVFGFELDNKKDFIHQRRSGLNHIMCTLAAKNNIKIAFSFSSLLNADDRQRNVLLGRIESNIKLCRKYKTKVVVGSFASKPYEMRAFNDLLALFSTLKLTSSEIDNF